MTNDHQFEIRPYLEEQERLLWSEKPKSGLVFRPVDTFLIPFSIMWCGFAIFWIVMAASAEGFFFLFGIPFVIIGLFFVFGRFIYDIKLRANTSYGITDDRIIIVSGIFSKSITSLNLRNQQEMEYKEKTDGSGTITFGAKNPMAMIEGMQWWPGAKTQPMLQLIPDVRKVHQLIIELQK